MPPGSASNGQILLMSFPFSQWLPSVFELDSKLLGLALQSRHSLTPTASRCFSLPPHAHCLCSCWAGLTHCSLEWLPGSGNKNRHSIEHEPDKQQILFCVSMSHAMDFIHICAIGTDIYLKKSTCLSEKKNHI